MTPPVPERKHIRFRSVSPMRQIRIADPRRKNKGDSRKRRIPCSRTRQTYPEARIYHSFQDVPLGITVSWTRRLSEFQCLKKKSCISSPENREDMPPLFQFQVLYAERAFRMRICAVGGQTAVDIHA